MKNNLITKFLLFNLIFSLIFSGSYAFGETENFISITSLDDIEYREYHEDDGYGLLNIFILENDKIRAICYNCGRPSLTINTRVEEWGALPIPCHTADWAGYSDLLIEYRYYNGEKCNSCGLNVSAYFKTIWKIQCNNGDDLSLFNTLFTIGEGGNIHCLVDPQNPYKHPYQ